MAISVVGQQPLAASGFASTFDAKQNALTKKRRLAEMLQQQVLTNNDDPALHTPGAKMSFLNPLGKLAQAGAAAYLDSKATDEEKENARQRQEDMASWLKSFPAGTPGQEAVEGTPDIPAIAAGAPIAQEQAPAPVPPSLGERFSQAIRTPTSPPPSLTDALLNSSPASAQGPFGPTPSTGSKFLPPPLDSLGQLPTSAAVAPTIGFLPKPLNINIPSPGAALPEGMSPHTLTTAQARVPGIPARAAVAAKPATPDEVLRWSAGGMNLGPVAAKIGDHFISGAAAQLSPKSAKDLYQVTATGDVLDFSKPGEAPTFLPIKGPMAEAKFDELKDAHNATRTLQWETLRERISRNIATEEETKRFHDLTKAMNDDRIQARKDAAAAAGSDVKGTFSDTGRVDKDGNPISFNNKTNSYSYAGTDKPFTPSAENPLLNTGDQKQFHAAKSKLKNADLLDSYAKRVGELKDEFTSAAGYAAATSNRLGGGGMKEATGHTDEGLKLRGEMTRTLADTVHDLMGAAVTPSEYDRNAAWLPKAGDNADDLIRKLNAASAAQRARAGNTTSDKVMKAVTPNAANKAAAPANTPAAPRSEAERKAMDKYGIK